MIVNPIIFWCCNSGFESLIQVCRNALVNRWSCGVGLPSLFILLSLLVLNVSVPAQEPRIWTDAKGRQVEASLVGFEDPRTILLQLGDGRTLPFPIANLNSSDHSFAKSQHVAFEKRKKSAESKPTQAIDWNKPANSDRFCIRSIRRSNSPGYVATKEGGWQYRQKCICVRIQYKGRSDVEHPVVKGYFYDRDGELIETYEKPPSQQEDNGQYISQPRFLKSRDDYEFYYPLTRFLEESDWATFVIVFGSGKEFSVDSFPKRSFKTLAFAEKSLVFPKGETAISTMTMVKSDGRR